MIGPERTDRMVAAAQTGGLVEEARHVASPLHSLAGEDDPG